MPCSARGDVPVIRTLNSIRAPIGICFDLARDIDLHRRSAVGTEEEAIAGVVTGLIGEGESVTWRARHFGLRLTLTSRITRFEYPRCFRDSQVSGPFRRFDHDHIFRPAENGTVVMEDVFDYSSPLGWLLTCGGSPKPVAL